MNSAPDPTPSSRSHAQPPAPLGFHLGLAGAAAPILVFAAGAAWLGFSGAPDERGLWPVLLAALGVGLLVARSASAYSAAALRGMSRPIVMLMVAAWLLAGVFSVVLREAGLVHALVWAGSELGVRGGGFVLMSFLIAVLFSTATGTSLGTILICAPLLYPAAGVLEASPVVLIGAILAGATFGDNVSPVSDTTIASASSQGAPMGGVVRSRLRYALPAAVVAAVVLTLLGGAQTAVTQTPGQGATLEGSPAALPMLLAPLAAFVMLWRGRGLVESLFSGVAAAVVLALALGLVVPADLVYIDREAFQARGLILDGMEGAVGIVVFTILLMGIVGAAQEAGILDRFAQSSRSAAETARAAELRIFGVTSVAVLLTTHSVMAILAVGDLVRDSGRRAGIGRFRRANLLDMTVCTYPFLLPFFIPTILAASATASGESFGIARVSALEAGLANTYSWALLAVMLAAIWTGLGRSEADTDPAI
ncbi:MAG: sodium:proton antiporter [Gammaproteobacteria bacterium]|nr:sodium:proton antiporter [Gammaproteobacteria bacterium]